MSRVPHRDTSIEMLARRALWAAGLRFRVDNADLPGRPDVANRTQRWVVFVHGCFWHRHPGCRRATMPKRNRELWLAKFRANRKRDAAAVAELRRLGYEVIVVWECDLRRAGQRQRVRLAAQVRRAEGLAAARILEERRLRSMVGYADHQRARARRTEEST